MLIESWRTAWGEGTRARERVRVGGYLQDLDIDAVPDPRALSVSKILISCAAGIPGSITRRWIRRNAEGVTLDSSPLIGKQVDYAHFHLA